MSGRNHCEPLSECETNLLLPSPSCLLLSPCAFGPDEDAADDDEEPSLLLAPVSALPLPLESPFLLLTLLLPVMLALLSLLSSDRFLSPPSAGDNQGSISVTSDTRSRTTRFFFFFFLNKICFPNSCAIFFLRPAEKCHTRRSFSQRASLSRAKNVDLHFSVLQSSLSFIFMFVIERFDPERLL